MESLNISKIMDAILPAVKALDGADKGSFSSDNDHKSGDIMFFDGDGQWWSVTVRPSGSN